MTKETIILNGQEMEVELRKINIICKAPDIVQDIQTPGRLMIDSQMTLTHTEEAKEFHPRTEKFFRMVFMEYDGEFTPEAIRREGSGAMHIAGLIDLSIICMTQSAKFGWKYPESFLHPKMQCQLADVVVAISNLEMINLDVEL